jgi:hypothetical protein
MLHDLELAVAYPVRTLSVFTILDAGQIWLDPIHHGFGGFGRIEDVIVEGAILNG